MKHLYLLIFLFISISAFSQNAGNEGDIEGFKLYPNPVTQGKVFINTAQNAPKKVFVYDVFGEKVIETMILGTELNLSNLHPGVYVLRVLEKNKVATRKLIIK